MDTKHIKISDYNYDLPDERIAKFPIAQRDHSKLLVYKHGEVSDDVFHHLPTYLPQRSLDDIQQYQGDTSASAFPQGNRCAY